MEPVGLVVRCLYPNLLTPVSDAMEAIRPALRRLFWHGVGRGLYFVPTNFLPVSGAHERMLRSAAEETTDAEDRRNVLSGLIWAVTLVNLRHPAALRSLTTTCAELKIQDEFTNGMISALLAWRHMAPEDARYIGTYTGPQPSNGDGVRWNDWIQTPSRDAMENISAGLERRNNIPALYTYRTREELGRLSAAKEAVQ